METRKKRHEGAIIVTSPDVNRGASSSFIFFFHGASWNLRINPPELHGVLCREMKSNVETAILFGV